MSEVNGWIVKDNLDTDELGTEEFWYDLTGGGYVRPEEILDDADQLAKLSEAVALVESFESLMDALGLIR